jgi:hypothetical protein
MSEGYIYAIKDSTGRYKIGKSIHPMKRMRELQTAQNDRLTIQYAIHVEDMAKAERAAHDLFAAWRKSGEWFEFDLKGYALFYKVFGIAPITADEERSLFNLGLRKVLYGH